MALRDLLRPFERQQLVGLSPAIGAGLDPSLAYQLMQQVIGGAQTRQSDRRQQFGQAAQGLTQAVASGAPSTALPGLASVYGAAAGLGPQGTGRLTDLVDQLYQGQETSPLYQGGAGASSASTVTPEEQPNLALGIQEAFAGLVDPADPAELQGIIESVRQKAIALGKNEQGIAASIQYAKLILSRLSGQSRSDLVNTLSPGPVTQSAAPAAPVVRSGIAGTYQPPWS